MCWWQSWLCVLKGMERRQKDGRATSYIHTHLTSLPPFGESPLGLNLESLSKQRITRYLLITIPWATSRSEPAAALARASSRTLKHHPPLPLGQPDSSGTPSPDDKASETTISNVLCATSLCHYIICYQPLLSTPGPFCLHYVPMTTHD